MNDLGISAELQAFLRQHKWHNAQIVALKTDASQRQYYRLSQNERSVILMDARRSAVGETKRFQRIASHLFAQDLSAPQIYGADHDLRALLVEDLGDDLLSGFWAKGAQSAYPIYQKAVDMLLAVQASDPPAFLAQPDAQDLAVMITPAFEFYKGSARVEADQSALLAALTDLLAAALQSAPVLALRDCHAENLLYLPARRGAACVGILDFQDAFQSHPAYDLMSLLQDVRRDIPASMEAGLIAYFVAQAGLEARAFQLAYAVLGVQRNLRILGVFARLALQENKANYLVHMPRVWRYIQRNLRAPGLQGLKALIDAEFPSPANLNWTV